MSMLSQTVEEIIIRSLVNKEKLPSEVKIFIDPIANDLRKIGSIIGNLSFDEPGSWLKIASNLLNEMVESEESEGGPFHDILISNEYTTVLGEHNKWVSEFLLKNVEMKTIAKEDRFVLLSPKNENIPLWIQVVESTGKVTHTLVQYWTPEQWEKIFSTFQEVLWKDRTTLLMSPTDSGLLGVATHELTDRDYVGPLLDQVIDLAKFAPFDIRRVCVLQGPPGTGKSTLCAHAARAIGNRTLVIENSVFNSLNRSSWFDILDWVGASVVIVDDIDRVSSGALSQALFGFEDTEYKVPITLMTTNDQAILPNAFRRPGRIDYILEVPEPPPEVRVQMIRMLAEREGLTDLPDNLMPGLDAMARRWPAAYLVEIIRRFAVFGPTYEVPENDIVMSDMWQECFK